MHGLQERKGRALRYPDGHKRRRSFSYGARKGHQDILHLDKYKYEPEPVDAPKQPPRKKMEKRKNAAKGTPTKPPMPDRRPDLSKLFDMAVSAPPKKGLLQFSDPKLAAATPTAQVEAPPELPSPPPA